MKIRIHALFLGFGVTAGSAFAVPPTIFVAWGEPNPPVLNVDYFVSTDPPASIDFPMYSSAPAA